MPTGSQITDAMRRKLSQQELDAAAKAHQIFTETDFRPFLGVEPSKPTIEPEETR